MTRWTEVRFTIGVMILADGSYILSVSGLQSRQDAGDNDKGLPAPLEEVPVE
jgi:hypothetical protein